MQRGIQTYGGVHTYRGHPNMWGLSKTWGHPDIQRPSHEAGFATSICIYIIHENEICLINVKGFMIDAPLVQCIINNSCSID